MQTYVGNTHVFNFNSDLSEIHIRDKESGQETETRISGEELYKFLALHGTEQFKSVPSLLEIGSDQITSIIENGILEQHRRLFEGINLIKGFSQSEEDLETYVPHEVEMMAYNTTKRLKEYFLSCYIDCLPGELITIDLNDPNQFGTFNPYRLAQEDASEIFKKLFAFRVIRASSSIELGLMATKTGFRFNVSVNESNEFHLVFFEGSPEEVKKVAAECHIELEEVSAESLLRKLALTDKVLADTVHDIIVQQKAFMPSDELISKVITLIPSDVLYLGAQWGYKDTEFGDKVYEWLDKNDYLSQIMEELNG